MPRNGNKTPAQTIRSSPVSGLKCANLTTTDTTMNSSDEIVDFPSSVGQNMSSAIQSTNLTKIKINPTSILWAAGIVELAVCVASEGSGPATVSNGTTISCNGNSCVCAALLLAVATGAEGNAANDKANEKEKEERERARQNMNNKAFIEANSNPSVVSEYRKILKENGILKEYEESIERCGGRNQPQCP